ncbi:hypothetical protein KZ483_27680 [Paenibacillus sp. sptzw28]|uniref:hypothetical protein n=1 Tax=Paenibacillus sp. sptzw28 TaxID=715179 RepID=UPI001C6EACE3|nr:hypothetical protein [Paenibacillus sp. sptzw28]QYR21405.1 hypothetical protein KZ483_27680 [Paenibacillus sp. sptzw28]
MNRAAGVLQMHLRDKWMWFYIPSIILMSSFLVNLIIGSLTEEPIYTGGLFSILIYMLVAGILTLTQTFPFALGLSVRRKDFYIGTASMIVLASAATAILLLILSLIEKWTDAWSTELHFFNLPYLSDGSAPQNLFIFFILLLHAYYLGFAISSVHRRFGRLGMYVFSIGSFLIFTIAGYSITFLGWWDNIWIWVADQNAFGLALWLIPPVAVYALTSYLLLRKATA